MKVLYPRCAGLDVRKKTVVACVRIQEGAAIEQEVRTFETTTSGLLDLSAWLSQKGCTLAAMEKSVPLRGATSPYHGASNGGARR